MSKKNKIMGLGLLLALLLAVVIAFFQHANVQVLNPAGEISEKERNLIYFALGLSLVVVIPVFFMLFYFAYVYREGNKKAKYSPDLAGSKLAEAIWWLVPTILITILGVVTWNSSHDLDPYKKIVSDKKPINIQVVSLDWRWLFIYPDQHIASINYFEFPENTPVNFELTSDSVMNSFWIPQLGSQIYCMPGMYSKLQLIANKQGTFSGSSANISGEGFADMFFKAKSTSETDFNLWVANMKKLSNNLDKNSYAELAKPTRNTQVKQYGWAQDGLFATIIGKYMVPTNAQGTGYIILGPHGHGGDEE
jgi:cytochrome o ubiquinol oxidase subunit 2